MLSRRLVLYSSSTLNCLPWSLSSLSSATSVLSSVASATPRHQLNLFILTVYDRLYGYYYILIYIYLQGAFTQLQKNCKDKITHTLINYLHMRPIVTKAVNIVCTLNFKFTLLACCIAKSTPTDDVYAKNVSQNSVNAENCFYYFSYVY